jgi:proline dehydrogenase
MHPGDDRSDSAFSILKESIAKMGIASKAEIEDWFTLETLGESG